MGGRAGQRGALVWCIRSSVVNKWVLYANPFLRFEQESGFLSFRKPSNNVVNYGYRTLERMMWMEDTNLGVLHPLVHVCGPFLRFRTCGRSSSLTYRDLTR